MQPEQVENSKFKNDFILSKLKLSTATVKILKKAKRLHL